MKIILVPPSKLVPYARNPRKNEAAVAKVAASIREFGFRQPIVADANMGIIVGHTRYLAALQLGLESVPVHIAEGLSPQQIKAYRIMDNRSHEDSDWDLELLGLELKDLESGGYDLGLTGLDEEEIERALAESIAGTVGLTDPDQVPDPPDKATTQRGDIWILGDHRLMCGDAASAEDVHLLLDGATIQLVNTDPPYNTKTEPRTSNAIASAMGNETIAPRQRVDVMRHPNLAKPTDGKLRPRDRFFPNESLMPAEYEQSLRVWFRNIAQVLEPGRSFYIWGATRSDGQYASALEDAGMYISQAIIWVKGAPIRGMQDYMHDYERCYYGWREGKRHHWYGPYNACDVWSIKKVGVTDRLHLTEKPVELARRAIEYSSLPGENVLDLFGGSGSTLIAAEQLGRRCFMMEIDPLYCDVIVQRWTDFTGREAKRISRGDGVAV